MGPLCLRGFLRACERQKVEFGMAYNVAQDHQVRSQILRETFDKLDGRQAVGIIGLMFERRFILKRGGWTLEALEPEEATRLLGVLFGLRPEKLSAAFRNQWGAIRSSPHLHALQEQLESHDLVERLEPHSTNRSPWATTDGKADPRIS